MSGLLVRVVLPYACCGVIVRDDRVVIAAPIVRWMIGKPASTCRTWVEGKGGTWG